MDYYVHSSRIRKRSGFSLLRFIGGILVLFLLTLSVKAISQKVIKQEGKTEQVVKARSSLSLPDAEGQVKDLIGKQKGSWSVYFVDFVQSGQRFGINEQVIYTAASVNKLYVLASLYYLAGKGQIDLDETVTLQAKDIQDFGTGSIRYDSPGTVYSLKTLARLLIEKSDNTAEYLLRTKIGDEKIQSLIDSWGMEQTSLVNNKTSLVDVERLFEKIRNNEVANKALTVEMMDFLDKTDFEDRLPALLPKDVHVYHKIGNEVGNIHDVGLIEKDGMVYFLGVFSSDIGDSEEEAKNTIAQVSRMVFDFKNETR